MNGPETARNISESEDMCIHGNFTGCSHCIAEAKEKKDQLQEFMESARNFDNSLDPREYNPERLKRLEDLHTQIDSERELGGGQNESRIFSLKSNKEGVYKPSSGESTVKLDRNISEGKAFIRDWLNHQIELNLEFNLVPPTIVRENSKGVGSVQEFVEGVDTAWSTSKTEMYETSEKIESKRQDGTLTPEEDKDKQTILWEAISKKAKKEQLIALAIQDFLTEQTDRHVNNFGLDEKGNVIAFDNPLSIPEKPEEWIDEEDPMSVGCKTILLKKLAGLEIPSDTLGKLEWYKNTPERQQKLKEAFVLGLGQDLGARKFEDFSSRIDFILTNKKVPSTMYKSLK